MCVPVRRFKFDKLAAGTPKGEYPAQSLLSPGASSPRVVSTDLGLAATAAVGSTFLRNESPAGGLACLGVIVVGSAPARPETLTGSSRRRCHLRPQLCQPAPLKCVELTNPRSATHSPVPGDQDTGPGSSPRDCFHIPAALVFVRTRRKGARGKRVRERGRRGQGPLRRRAGNGGRQNSVSCCRSHTRAVAQAARAVPSVLSHSEAVVRPCVVPTLCRCAG